MILADTIEADYRPGTNQDSDYARADWRFLLPDLEPKLTVVLGRPRASALRVLSRNAADIVIAADDMADVPGTEQSGVSVVAPAALELASKTVSLLLLAEPAAIARFRSDAAYRARLFDALADDGCIAFEQSMWEALRLRISTVVRLSNRHTAAAVQRFWVTRRAGEVRTAIPTHDRRISGFFFRNVLHGISRLKRALSFGGRILSRLGLTGIVNQGSLTLILPGESGHAGQAPRFLRRLAQEQGVALDSQRCGLAARGTYNSNKVIYYLFEPSAADPDIVVKMTRVADFNNRLEHEWDMLSEVRDRQLARAGSYPEPLFFGYHSGLAILGERAMRGQPFRTATSALVDCPVAADAIEWIVDLGCRSATGQRAATADVTRSLSQLLAIFAQIYEPDATVLRFLTDQIRSLTARASEMPIVFSHGDAGTWNVVVNAEGRTVFLDWEAAEPRGMPLWDLFYFYRSFGNWVARQRDGERDTARTFERTFLDASELNERLVTAVDGYCERVGLDRDIVEPMFYTCWMHRALRQATWAGSLQSAHFITVLQRSIDRPESPGLLALFRGR